MIKNMRKSMQMANTRATRTKFKMLDESEINRRVRLKVFAQVQYLMAFDIMEMRTLSATRANPV